MHDRKLPAPFLQAAALGTQDKFKQGANARIFRLLKNSTGFLFAFAWSQDCFFRTRHNPWVKKENMSEQQRAFFEQWNNPIARLTVEQAAWALNFQAHDIPVLVRAGLLKPLGNPAKSATKYFSAVAVRDHAKDLTWLARATNVIYRHWQDKNNTEAA
jgi:hypothetical protein